MKTETDFNNNFFERGQFNHCSLFTGIGGFDLAAEWIGWNNIFQVELNEFCQKKLTKNFPNVTKYKDIKQFDGTPYAKRIDILTGGFPCQSFSVAGKGAVDLTLWKEMLRTITEIKPPFVVAENVPGLVSRKNGMAFNIVCTDLENLGYEVQPLNIPIAGKGAPHERERIWFIAYSDRFRCDNEQEENRQIICNEKRNSAIEKQSGREQQCRLSKSDSDFADTESTEQKRTRNTRARGNGFANDHILSWKRNWVEVAAEFCRVDAGVSDRVDRLMALGNSISPILAFEFFKIIDFILREGRKKLLLKSETECSIEGQM